ncbi:hypothetical protein EUGRSUZ_C00264 [Eucalyptus grandis]|uniref:Uncharacterized protein n=2 Tax=Eucalyptus grandis TaxID=71139 RepID=A0ACC3LA22_EUCGR|nr:hypothetical protein EUGRSUZ_C00264 [Eucalyptus grandis]
MIPKTLGQLKNLVFLTFGENKFVGTIPISIFNISTMTILEQVISMGGNHLTGPIPESISNASNLMEIQVQDNNLIGKVPSFSKIRGLNWFNIDKNNLGGEQSTDLDFLYSLTNSTKLENLLLLHLSTNDLSGNIPPKIMGLSSLSIYLDLSQNSLTGSLPKEVGNLRNLGELSLNENKLSQQIPSNIGSCTSIERLYVHDNFFEGHLPSTMSSMRGLQVLNVSNNQLSGQIPEYLASLNLTNLSLSYNNFEGALPIGGIFKSAISTSVAGNKKLCGGLLDFQLPKCDYEESKWRRISGTTKVLIFIVSTLVGVTCILSLLYFFWFRRNKKASTSSSSEDRFLHVSYHNLLKATGGFSSTNLLGVGNFGSVYRGLLDQTQLIVAIKILNLACHGASKSFVAECEVLRRIQHRNLVKVLTVCSGFDFNGNDFKALVYEFMANGSLDEWLHLVASQYTKRSKLSLLERVNISIDIACALDYLHHYCEMPIVHCDLKPSNILLDDERTGHLGDFGLARFLPEAMHKLLANQSSSVKVKGSFGYIAPEYGMGSAVSTQGDMYSFGVLILEMFTGKRPTDDMFENGLDLHYFAKATLTDQMEKAIDPVMLQEIEELNKTQRVTPEGKNKSWSNIQDCLASIIKIGVACSFESPRERMDIGDTLTRLQGIRKKLLNFIVIG